MCDDCGPRVRALAAPLCERCGAPTALAVSTCRACARLRWFTTARSAFWLEGPRSPRRRALEARRDLTRRAWRAALVAHELPRPRVEALAVVPAVRDRRCSAAPTRPRSWRASSARGGTCRSCRSCAARATSARSAGSTRAPAGATCAAPSPPARARARGARRRRLHDGRDRRRVRPGTARGGRRAGPRDRRSRARPSIGTFARAPPRGRLQVRRTRAGRHVMQLQVSGRNLDVTEPIREYAERKLARIERHLTEDTRVDLELAIERNPSISANQVAEPTVWTKGPVLRAHESADGHVRGDRPRGRQARPPGAALPRATPPLAAASPGATTSRPCCRSRRRTRRLGGARAARSRSCRCRRSSRRSAST